MHMGRIMYMGQEITDSMSIPHNVRSPFNFDTMSLFSFDKDGGNILTAAARSGNAMLINWIMDVCQIEPVVNIVSL